MHPQTLKMISYVQLSNFQDYNPMLSKLFAASVLIASFCVQPGVCAAADDTRPTSNFVGPFEVSAGLQGRVEFWRLVFTKYGKEDVVFHHRQYPEIIYSVLDFSDFRARYSEREYIRKRREVVGKEERRIREALLHLGGGAGPRNDFESRIVGLFEGVGLDDRRDFRAASDTDMIRSQTGIKERFRDGIRRSGRYLPAIEKVFVQAGLPVELGRLPLVESSFDYDAYSSAGAAGIWQFTRSTGSRFLRINSAIDERRDPIAATRAAARYLQNSFEKLGTWPLAITSYNHGLSGVMRAVKETGSRDLSVIVHTYKGRSFGFASSNFYAEFIAALLVEQNWQQYFPDLVKEPPKQFDAVELHRTASYRELVQHSGFDDEEFCHWNPALLSRVRRGAVHVPKGVTLYVRKGHGQSYSQALGGGRIVSLRRATEEYFSQEKPKRLVVVADSYLVRPGDTIGEIARKHGVSQRSIMYANNISDPRSLRAGQRISIPSGQARDPGRSKPLSSAIVYEVQSGDNLTDIAKAHGTSVAELRMLNPKLSEYIYPGQKIRVERAASKAQSAPPEAPPAQSVEKSYYVVRQGDSLYGIAEKNAITLTALRALNPGVDSTILPGQKLVITGGAAAAIEPARTYIVEKGDNLSSIAKKLGISLGELKAANPDAGTLIRPGQRLVVP